MPGVFGKYKNHAHLEGRVSFSHLSTPPLSGRVSGVQICFSCPASVFPFEMPHFFLGGTTFFHLENTSLWARLNPISSFWPCWYREFRNESVTHGEPLKECESLSLCENSQEMFLVFGSVLCGYSEGTPSRIWGRSQKWRQLEARSLVASLRPLSQVCLKQNFSILSVNKFTL